MLTPKKPKKTRKPKKTKPIYQFWRSDWFFLFFFVFFWFFLVFFWFFFVFFLGWYSNPKFKYQKNQKIPKKTKKKQKKPKKTKKPTGPKKPVSNFECWPRPMPKKTKKNQKKTKKPKKKPKNTSFQFRILAKTNAKKNQKKTMPIYRFWCSDWYFFGFFLGEHPQSCTDNI